MIRRAIVVGGLCLGMLAVPGVAIAGPFDPGVGVCVPLPDPPLLLDWTIRALKIALGGEVDCGL